MDFLKYVCRIFELDAFEAYCVQGALQRELSNTAGRQQKQQHNTMNSFPQNKFMSIFILTAY